MGEHILKEAGLRVTPLRKAMLELLEKMSSMTAEEVFDNLSKQRPCALSTVYRAMNTMEEHEILQKIIHQDGRFYYRLNHRHHDHKLVCELCHESVLIGLCPLEQLERDLRKGTGYQITSHRFEISGICPKCANIRKNDD